MSFSIRPHQRSGVINTLHDHEQHWNREKKRLREREAEERRRQYGYDVSYDLEPYSSRRRMSDESSWESRSDASSGYGSSSSRRPSTSGHSSSRLRDPPSSYRDPSRSSYGSHSDRYDSDRYDSRYGGSSHSRSSRGSRDDDRSGYDIYLSARKSSYGRERSSGGGLKRSGAVHHASDRTFRAEQGRDDNGRMDHGRKRYVRGGEVRSGQPTFHYVRDQYEPHHRAIFDHTDNY